MMALLGLLALLIWGKGLRNTAPLWLLLAVLIVQGVSWTAGYWHHPEWVPSHPKLDRLAKWFLFLGMAWWLGGSTRLTYLAWAMAVAGLVASVVLPEGSVQQWRLGLEGQRVDFGIHNSQHISMFFGVALIGLLCLSKGILAAGRGIWVRRVAWLVAITVCLVGVAVTQTRAVWLALSLVLVTTALVAVLYHYRKRREGLPKKRFIFLLPVILALLSAMLYYAFHDTIERRLQAEEQIIAQVLEGDWENIPYSSIGNRVHSFRAALQWFSERPLVGWGENGRSLVMKHTEWLPEQSRQHFGHIHNTMLEVMVAYGLLGLVVVSLLVFWIGLGSWKAWRAGVMPDGMALFGFAFFGFYFIVNQFEAYGSFWSGVYVQNLIAGGLVTHIWRWQHESGQAVFPLFRRSQL
ncbi:O-antigen ligase family protein [Billgrantia sp. LNSP4103-1]|uniref:O-antigen ligase family protein n=1 Tax=Billgrantia sp. LNSP4103-1 TaxID=3410266 RepID=UPI00403F7670